MSKYDFSGIPTDILREAVSKHPNCTCVGISCSGDNCPFKPIGSLCETDIEEAQRLFKEELERRDNMESNKMPEIKEGQVVKIKWLEEQEVDYYLVVNGYGIGIDKGGYLSTYRDHWKASHREVIGIYKLKEGCSFNHIVSNLELVWEKSPEKTEQELKIEELQKTIEEASKQIEELGSL